MVLKVRLIIPFVKMRFHPFSNAGPRRHPGTEAPTGPGEISPNAKTKMGDDQWVLITPLVELRRWLCQANISAAWRMSWAMANLWGQACSARE